MAKFRLLEEEETIQDEPKKTIKSPFRLVDENKKEPTFLDNLYDNLKELPAQFIKGTATGAAGTYGDLLDLAGLQSKEILEGDKIRRGREYDILTRMQQPGYIPSIGELDLLTDSDELPNFSRLPSSEQVTDVIEKSGGPGKPNTAAGRYASRSGQLVGGSLAFGQPGLAAPIAAGIVGQTAEEAGAPPWVQAALEIGTFIKAGKAGQNITSKSPEIKQQLDRLRKLGFSEEDLTLAKNALEDKGFLKKVAKMTPESKERFNNTLSSLENKSSQIVSDAFPGIERGIEAVEKEAGELYSIMNEMASSVNIPRGSAVIETGEKILQRLRKTLANTPEEKQMLGLVEEAINSAQKPLSADYYTRFYRGLNKLGKWVDPSERERIFTEMKDAIKQTFKESGREGEILARRFEDANIGWRKFRQAEDVSNLIGKAITEEGTNYTKMTNLLDNPKNFDMLVEGMGKQSAENLRLISKTGKNIKNLSKQIEGSTAKEVLGAGKLWSLVKAVTTGDLSSLKTYVGAEALGRLSNKLLTDPSYQNLHLQLLKKINANKWSEVRSIANQLQKKLDSDSQNGSVKKK